MRVTAVISLVSMVLVGCGGAQPLTGTDRARTGRPHASLRNGPVLLGSKDFIVWGGIGFGTAHPSKLVVGGDPAVMITHIRWHGWGRPETLGIGDYAVPHFGRGGSYYRRPFRADLRASGIGRCRPNGPRAYMVLKVKVALEPGQRPSWYQANGRHGLCRYP